MWLYCRIQWKSKKWPFRTRIYQGEKRLLELTAHRRKFLRNSHEHQHAIFFNLLIMLSTVWRVAVRSRGISKTRSSLTAATQIKNNKVQQCKYYSNNIRTNARGHEGIVDGETDITEQLFLIKYLTRLILQAVYFRATKQLRKNQNYSNHSDLTMHLNIFHLRKLKHVSGI